MLNLLASGEASDTSWSQVQLSKRWGHDEGRWRVEVPDPLSRSGGGGPSVVVRVGGCSDKASHGSKDSSATLKAA